MENRVKLENIAIILVEPQIPENIGGVARAMNNMGFKQLILVNPKNLEQERISKMATGDSTDILNHMEIYEDIHEAIGPFHFIVGTTARNGAMRPAMTDPRRLASDLVDVSEKNRVAILFGREDRGLANDHLKYCHTFTTIPTADFTSLNLAQAVMIVCYEIFLTRKGPSKRSIPRLANRFELEGMYGHAKDVLEKIGFLNPQNPDRWMWNVRKLFDRYRLRAIEVRTIRGICRQVDWYTGQIEKIKERDKCDARSVELDIDF